MEFEIFALKTTDLKFLSVWQPPFIAFSWEGVKWGCVCLLGLSFLFRPFRGRGRASDPLHPSSLMQCIAPKSSCAAGILQPNSACCTTGSSCLGSGSQSTHSGFQLKLFLWEHPAAFISLGQIQIFCIVLCYGDCYIAKQLKIKHRQYGKNETTVSVLGTESISPPFQVILQFSLGRQAFTQYYRQQVCQLLSVWVVPSACSGCRIPPSSNWELWIGSNRDLLKNMWFFPFITTATR